MKNLVVTRCVRLAFVLCFIGLASTWSEVHASLPNYFTRLWQTQDGLPDNDVTSVLQTQDGYIWVGTRSGLARFNGERFVVFEDINTPAMHGRHVSCLFETRDGTLWIGFETGEVVKHKDGHFEPVPIQAAWRGGKIFAIAVDRESDVWLVNQFGEILRVRDQLVIASPLETDAHLLSIARDPRGGFWLQRDNEILELRKGTLNPVQPYGLSTNQYVQGIGFSRRGGLWIMAENRIREWRDRQWTVELGEPPWLWSPAHTLTETRNGYLAGATADHGLYLVIPGSGTLTFSRTNGFSSDWVTALCEDREGNLWAGTANGGLAMLRIVSVSTYNPPDLWQGRSVLSVAAAPDNTLWVGTEGAGLYRFREGGWSHFDEQDGIEHRYIWAVNIDDQHRVSVGTWGGGVFRQEGSRFVPAPGLEGLSVGAIQRARTGGLYVGTRTGFLRYDRGEVEWLLRAPTLASPDVRAIVEAADGTVWLGLFGGGLACFKEGRWKQFRRAQGLSSDFVQCLYPDADGALWIGTLGGGINRRIDGKFEAITEANGLPNDVICHIAEDDQGFIWISTQGGIARVSRAELTACAEGDLDQIRCLSYGLSDGLPTLECSGGSQPSGARTEDGCFWYPTAKGLVKVDPDDVTVNDLPPPVVIEGVRVDEEPMRSGQATPLQIAPGRRRLEFSYAGLSFVAPERVRFKYRLAGLERSWVQAGTRRVANYSYLPPGDYTFEVMASNNDGVWNDTTASVTLTMLPFFWQTGWFRLMVALLMVFTGGAFVWLDTRRRMQRKLERIGRQRAIERERARIAKDIHDDLGASLTRITLLSQTARAELDDLPEAAEAVDRIYTTGRELTRAMDEIVWAMNPQHDTLDSLATYLGKYAHDYLRAAGVRCHLDLPDQLPNWALTADVRHNLFLAFKEALHNVVKHAAAPAAHVRLVLQEDGFELVLEDQGRGFSEGTATRDVQDPDRIQQGNGLTNMKRRLQAVGGSCTVDNAQGKGTRVSFRLAVASSRRDETRE